MPSYLVYQILRIVTEVLSQEISKASHVPGRANSMEVSLIARVSVTIYDIKDVLYYYTGYADAVISGRAIDIINKIIIYVYRIILF